MMNARMRQTEGMTIMETIMALLVLAMGMTGAVSLIMASMKQSTQAQMHYVAANIAKARIERARVSDYATLLTLAEDKTRVDEEGNPDWSGQYRRTTVVSDVTPNLRQVAVYVEIISKMDQVFGGDTGLTAQDGYATEAENMTSLFADFQTVNE